jgi:DNA (cytosine-5)-methyltransferase 1
MKNKKFRHLSLFSGCGGMDIGINGNFKVIGNFVGSKNKWTQVPKTKFETIFANDIKKSSKIFWEHNFKNSKNFFVNESIVDLVKKYKKGNFIFPKNVDLVTGGFPCQDFSISGWRQGFDSHKSHLNTNKVENRNESRGKLYLWMKEVINITKPKFFIAENVKGLTNFKEVFEIIKHDFRNTGKGYKVFSRELFAPDFGIPQSRRRIFIIGASIEFLKKNNIDLEEDDLFPQIEFSNNHTLFKKYLKYPIAKLFFTDLKEPSEEKIDLSQMSYSKAKYLPKLQGNIEIKENGFAPTIRSEHHGNIEFRYLKKINGGKNLVGKNKIQRRLTVRECARIQTFPDEIEFVIKKEKQSISASSAYKLIGDAVPPLLANKIIKKIEKILIKYL